MRRRICGVTLAFSDRVMNVRVAAFGMNGSLTRIPIESSGAGAEVDGSRAAVLIEADEGFMSDIARLLMEALLEHDRAQQKCLSTEGPTRPIGRRVWAGSGGWIDVSAW